MSRLIDADALTEIIHGMYAEGDDPSTYHVDVEGDTLIGKFAVVDAIFNMPTIQPEPHWIPVTERLPEKSGEYLVTVKWVTGESDVDVYEYDARHKTWNDGESAGGERAVAWCNLPEPYKGVTE